MNAYLVYSQNNYKVHLNDVLSLARRCLVSLLDERILKLLTNLIGKNILSSFGRSRSW